MGTNLNKKTIALAGNPNVGKSTVFNGLTNMNQHTGNWPGKTVTNAQGIFTYKDTSFHVMDLPGTYSLSVSSAEEEIARDYICSGEADVIVVVTDATCLERNLNLVLQILHITKDIVVCVNLLDEAKKKKIHVDLNRLSQILNVPVIGTTARSDKSLTLLKETMYQACYRTKKIDERKENILPCGTKQQNPIEPDSLRQSDESDCPGDYSSLIVPTPSTEESEEIVYRAKEIYVECVTTEHKNYNAFDRKIDNIVTSKKFGIPIMLLLLCSIFWITIVGANYPSDLLSTFFTWLEERLLSAATFIHMPEFLQGILILGIYKTLTWVISVMLPPMAIFFPLFTLLEDFGYLPRIAFNMDTFFKKACAHGKQALTMWMVSYRISSSN